MTRAWDVPFLFELRIFAKSADVPLWLYDTNGVPKLLRSGTRSFAARPPFRELLARRRALELFSPSDGPPPVDPRRGQHAEAKPVPGPILPSERDRLAKAIEADPELLALTTSLLRARAIALAAASERDVVAHAIDDLRPFSPRDRVAAELVRRMATSRGAIDVRDLVP